MLVAMLLGFLPKPVKVLAFQQLQEEECFNKKQRLRIMSTTESR